MLAEEMEKRARLAILELRKQKHKCGHPFMINSSELPEGQFWMEYPNGQIHLMKLTKSRTDFETIRVLTTKEADIFRIELGI